MSNITQPLSPDSSDLETPPCPLCGDSQADHVLSATDTWIPQGRNQGRMFTIRRCRSCSCLYTSPRYPSTIKALAFQGDYPHYLPARQSDACSHRQLQSRLRPFRRREEILRPWFAAPGKVLDIGMGDGCFLKVMQDAGWDCTGMDTETDMVAHARAVFGLSRCQTGDADVEDLPPGTFDLISLWGMFQLSYRPAALLGKIRQSLSPGGMIALGLSNSGSLGARLFGPRWHGWGLPRHLVHHTPRSLSRLLEAQGFAILAIHYETPYWITAPSAAGFLPRFLPKKVRAFFLHAVHFILQPWSRSPWGDTMTVLARIAPAEASARMPIHLPPSGPGDSDSF